MKTDTYQFDAAMCGADFAGDLERVAQYLTDAGYPSQAVTSSHNGAPRHAEQEAAGVAIPPENVWLRALEYGNTL